ncbi:hypothetical protein, partial [Salmonella enterica]|uniref:hypothetical protein n=1 Tax=Salmonella enterica TaxID=28901 RepID=UPI0035253D65
TIYVKYVPVKTGATVTPWALAVAAPLDVILAGSRTIVWTTIGVGGATMLLLMLAVYMVTRAISKPLHGVIVSLNLGVDQVNAAAEHVAGSSQSMAEGASAQASS